mmetsp:Transcript_12220/g.27674  ORF Transcript_12220/g.27674 Transcript_12220/m.27674 type:complete len:389 (-) Transcript_12220:57-1223(-)
MGGRASTGLYKEGDEVELCNFKNKPDLNGRKGTIRGPNKKKPGHWDVKIDASTALTVPEANIRRRSNFGNAGDPHNPYKNEFGSSGATAYGNIPPNPNAPQASAVVIGPDRDGNGIPDVLEPHRFGNSVNDLNRMKKNGYDDDRYNYDREHNPSHHHHHHHHRSHSDEYGEERPHQQRHHHHDGRHHHHHHHDHDPSRSNVTNEPVKMAMAVVSGADLNNNGIPDSLEDVGDGVYVQGFSNRGGPAGTGLRSLYEPGTVVEVKWYEDKHNRYEEWLLGVVVMARHIQNLYLVELEPGTPPFWCPLDCLRKPLPEVLAGMPMRQWAVPPPALLPPQPPFMPVPMLGTTTTMTTTGYAPLPPAHMLAAGPAPGYPYGVPGGRPPALTWGP